MHSDIYRAPDAWSVPYWDKHLIIWLDFSQPDITLVLFFCFQGFFMFLFHCLLNSEVCNRMVLTNLGLPNSKNISVRQEQTFSIIIACYVPDFLLLLINPWLFWLYDLKHFYPCSTFVLISIRKVWNTEQRQEEQFQSQEKLSWGLGAEQARAALGGEDV